MEKERKQREIRGMLKRRKKESNEGITMMVLVITIIVLLILAGISISTLFGPNGVLTEADEAKQAAEESSAKEKVQIQVLRKL